MIQNFEKTFDNAAEEYERIRPVYPQAIFDDILSYKPVGPGSSVLEIGIGTGLATAPLLDTGCELIGIEPGANLAQIAAEKYRGRGNLKLYTQTLQDYDCPDESFDLIYAATAFHWIPEEYGYNRVFTLLRKGGAFARFRYHAGKDEKRCGLASEIQALYKEYVSPKTPAKFGEADAGAVADIARKYGFIDTRYRLYHTTKDFTTEEYLSLLRTYPDHIKLPEPQRGLLFDGIRRAIEKSGGTITVYYTMDLELARRPAD